MINILNMRDEWSWIECSEVELQRCAKLKCSEVEVVRKLENGWNMSMLTSFVLLTLLKWKKEWKGKIMDFCMDFNLCRKYEHWNLDFFKCVFANRCDVLRCVRILIAVIY